MVAAREGGTATFVVNSIADGTDGVCGAAPNGCTLREAITAAVSLAGRDAIAFDPAVFPPATPQAVSLVTPLPLIVDSAGTVVDGAGAGVIVEPGVPTFPGGTGLAFASGAGVALAKVTVANVTVRGFGIGIQICGGAPPNCEENVSSALVQNVFAEFNGSSGIEIRGATVSKTRVVASVARANAGTGINCIGSQKVVGTRIERTAARDNGGAGLQVSAEQLTTGTVITDSVADSNDSTGIAVGGRSRAEKTKLTNVTATRNGSAGLSVETLDQLASVTIANVVATSNANHGLRLTGETIAGVTVKDAVMNDNLGGLGMFGNASITGVKLTNVRAVFNGEVGIDLTLGSAGQVIGAKVSRALLSGNGGGGLRLRGTGCVVQQVHASTNGADGIRIEGVGGGNTVTKSRASANGGRGIALLAGSTSDVVQKNVALGNDGDDLSDENAACDGNTWKQNVFRSRNAACID